MTSMMTLANGMSSYFGKLHVAGHRKSFWGFVKLFASMTKAIDLFQLAWARSISTISKLFFILHLHLRGFLLDTFTVAPQGHAAIVSLAGDKREALPSCWGLDTALRNPRAMPTNSSQLNMTFSLSRQIPALQLEHLQQHENAVEGDACYYHCVLCNYSTKAKLNLIQHVRSMKHQRSESLRKLQRLQKGLPEEEEDLSSIFTIRKCPSSDTERAGGSKGMICAMDEFTLGPAETIRLADNKTKPGSE
ncbi:Zinc finger homeobox protein 3 AT motif-binding factor 1 AT-binding transcription factor 1 [Collichthys lucidus]|uniref:Zinc finger homeobox protein 3 AT motif-binding factor 1 AT-binding transcription factor 1 n=1 Tax=Collichthys lucidus TaxID=240159 RepID=A0A4U5UAN1_COLLU|nr:Zinc finger homeobox protein 3 AT motif-binding factor 1 AT-binding transcription factor 1 [Collichthys lucidus]